jgi:aryl-alcohol dehydrogenase-like predicted oxidoreductase
MNFGGSTDNATAMRIVDRARDVGGNFIDTADAYTPAGAVGNGGHDK